MRFLPHTAEDRSAMLAKIGAKSVDELYSNVPAECNLKAAINLPTTKPEQEVEKIFAGFAGHNHGAQKGPFFLGAGVYYHHIPATVDYIIQRSEFLTSYTPYQPEVSQGTLQVIFEFQSMIAALTGMEIANASMYDGATAVAEAALMAKRLTKKSNIAIHGSLHPHYRETLETYLKHLDSKITDLDENCACVIVQYPDFRGDINDLEKIKAEAAAKGALLVVAVTEIVALGLLPAPSCADIVAGECQSIGIPMMFGGPYAGFFACSQANVRQMPGRLCGLTTDVEGRRSFVLTLSTREQHIRREKATSNICTNQGLCALAFTVHLSLLGEEGFKQLANLNHSRAVKLADEIGKIKGFEVVNKNFFNEFVVKTPINAQRLINELAEIGIIAGYSLGGHELLVTATEMTSDEDIKQFVKELSVF